MNRARALPAVEQSKQPGESRVHRGRHRQAGEDDQRAHHESIDLRTAAHPQTLLAYDLNGETLPITYGAPIRLRLGRQLGYKMAKYVMHIQLVSSYRTFGQGQGGYWEDQGYTWYAGI